MYEFNDETQENQGSKLMTNALEENSTTQPEKAPTASHLLSFHILLWLFIIVGSLGLMFSARGLFSVDSQSNLDYLVIGFASTLTKASIALLVLYLILYFTYLNKLTARKITKLEKILSYSSLIFLLVISGYLLIQLFDFSTAYINTPSNNLDASVGLAWRLPVLLACLSSALFFWTAIRPNINSNRKKLLGYINMAILACFVLLLLAGSYNQSQRQHVAEKLPILQNTIQFYMHNHSRIPELSDIAPLDHGLGYKKISDNKYELCITGFMLTDYSITVTEYISEEKLNTASFTKDKPCHTFFVADPSKKYKNIEDTLEDVRRFNNYDRSRRKY